MTASLRSGHRDHTQERIFRALSEFIVEEGLENLSLPALARKAGVATATLYRHFASKDALLDGFFAWLDTQGTGVDPPRTRAELVDLLPRLYEWFDRNDPVIRAGLMTGIGRDHRARQRSERWQEQWGAIEEATKGLDERDARHVHAAVRLLVNSQSWLTLREEEGLSGRAAGEVAAWILEAVLEKARR